MKYKVASLLMFFGLAGSLLAPVHASASQSVIDAGCVKNPSSPICNQTKNAETKTYKFARDIISTLLLVISIVAVIMIIVGALKYVTSEGDSGKTSSAKNTILYSVVGLVVALLAYAIVNFILGQF